MPVAKRKHPAKPVEFEKFLDSRIQEIGEVADTRQPIRKTIGKQSKMGFVEFLNHLFDLNEYRKWTDAQLKVVILDEFGHSAKTVASFSDGNQCVSKIRHEFNQGFFQPSVWPPENPGRIPRLSLRYNAQGKPVNSRSPTKIATNGFLKLQLEKFTKVLETYEELLLRLGRSKKKWNDPEAID